MGRQREINWKSYNRNLIKQGSISFWVDKQTAENWFSQDTGKGFQRKRSFFVVLDSRESLTAPALLDYYSVKEKPSPWRAMSII